MTLAERRRALIMGIRKSRLPKEYQEVEWIGTDGSAYLVSDFNINNLDRFTIYYEYDPNGTTYNYVFGATDFPNTGSRFLHRYMYLVVNNASGGTFLNIPIGTGFYAIKVVADNVANTITIYNDDGSIYTSNSWENYKNFTGFGFLCNNYNSQPQNAVARANTKIKRLDFYDDDRGEWVWVPVPCYRKADGAIGIYDIVTGTFNTNQGSGSFTKGADVNILEV